MMRAYLGRELDVHEVCREVYDGALAADVEDGVIVRRFDVVELLRVRELVLHNWILEERVCVLSEELDASGVQGRVWALRRGEVDVILRSED